MSVDANPIVSLTSTAFASSVSSSTFCDGEAITFTATSTSGISTYTFMVGGVSQKTGPSNTFSPAAFSSTVSVAVRVETAAGCTATDTLDLFYNDIDVTGTIGQASATVCENETPPAFTNDAAATATIGTISYRWETRTLVLLFSNTISAVTTAVYTPTSALTTTTFYRRVAISTYGGATCEEYSNIIQIGVSQPPITGLQAQGGAITAQDTVTLCTGESITFNATGGGSEFLFYLDDNPLGVKSGSSILTTNTLITGSRIKVESFNAQGCSSFSPEIEVQIVDNPIISLTSTAYASSASSSTFCEGESITFTASSTSAISTYTFSIGGIPQLVTTTNTFTPVPVLSSTTSVSVMVETAAGCTATETLDMYLNEITSSGNIGQVSATVCAGEIPHRLYQHSISYRSRNNNLSVANKNIWNRLCNVPASATTAVYTDICN